jgi:glycosyltransferase involved in cell wall biosynthesis
MMMNGVIPIYSNVGALPNVIGDGGINLGIENKDILTVLKELDNEKRNQLMRKGIERSKLYIDTVVKEEWMKLFNKK